MALLKRSLSSFLVMLAAWPLGLVAAVVVLFVPFPWQDRCPAGTACELHRVSWLAVLGWLCIALGPGVIATTRWWRGHGPAA